MKWTARTRRVASNVINVGEKVWIKGPGFDVLNDKLTDKWKCVCQNISLSERLGVEDKANSTFGAHLQSNADQRRCFN